MDRRTIICDFVASTVREGSDPAFDPASGELLPFLDSVLLLQLVLFIEQRFNISLDMGEFDIENFESVDSLLAGLERVEKN